MKSVLKANKENFNYLIRHFWPLIIVELLFAITSGEIELFKKHDTLEVKLFDSISLYFSKINGKKSLRLDWFGGEPMLFFNKMVDYCIRINKYCVEHEILFQHSMTTNGYLLTKDKAAKLIECGINLYQITIDGTSNTHDKYRQLKNGSPTWQTIVNNLIDLKNIAEGG